MNKDIYFFWDRPHLYFLEYLSFFTFRLHNPDWNIKVVIKENPGQIRWPTGEHKRQRGIVKNFLPDLNKLNVQFLSLEKDFPQITALDKDIAFVHAKDILNWYILAELGGVVADTDILFVRPIDSLYKDFESKNSKIGLISFINHPKVDYIPVSFMMGDKSFFFKEVYLNARSRYNPAIYECAGTDCIPYKNWTQICARFPQDVYRLNEKVVFPFTHVNFVDSIGLIYGADSRHLIGEDSIGLHWYGGNLPEDYNETNYMNYNNTITGLIKIIYDNRNL